MKLLYILGAALPAAWAFPVEFFNVLSDPEFMKDVMKRAPNAPNATVAVSQAEGNCGPIPCGTFNAEEQYVSNTGEHAYQSPLPSDIRGPCPGLNAAANHGYLPRNGILDSDSTANGLLAAYGMSEEFGRVLNAFSSIFTGDILSETWSIGGPMPGIQGPLGYPPQGISYSHNKYEGDTSIARNDAYLNNGDAHSANVTRFAKAVAVSLDDDRFTLDKFRVLVGSNQEESIMNNPYYFSPFVSTTAVAPAAYNFIINFMSNHSAEEPEGYLNQDMLKTFFAMEGDYPNYTWNRGQERIPDNWYRRTNLNPYGIAPFAADLVIGWAAYPLTFKLGGNTAGVNTYEGVDVYALTKGSYNFTDLLEGDNFACLFFQAQQFIIPDELKGADNLIQPALDLFNSVTDGFLDSLTCPQLAGYDATLFNGYPGRTYSPTGPDTNY